MRIVGCNRGFKNSRRPVLMLVSFRGGVRFPKADLSPSTRGYHPVLRRPWTQDDLLGRSARFVERSGYWGRSLESQSQAFAGLLAARSVVLDPGSDPLLRVGSAQPVRRPVRILRTR